MTWFLAWLMIFVLWLLLREKQVRQQTTEEIVEKYRNLANSRKTERSGQQTRREPRSQRKSVNRTGVGSEIKRVQQVDRQQSSESLEKEKELLSLIRDRKTCERLLKGLRSQYPDESRLWIVEKAISDVERDRR